MNGGALAHVGFPRPVQQVHFGRALGGTQTTRIIDLAGALVGSNPGQDLFKNVPTWSSEKPFDIGFRGTIPTISYSGFGFRSNPRVNGCRSGMPA